MLNGISWEDFFMCLGGVLILYYACVLVIYRPKTKHAAGRRERATKRVWQVEEQPADVPEPPPDHIPYMGLGADHAPLIMDHLDAAVNEGKAVNAVRTAPQEAGDDTLDEAESLLDALIAGFEGGDAQALLQVLRDAIQRNPVLTHYAYKGILSRLIVQKAWVFKKIELSDEQVKQLWA